jgi:hypothetical protein
MSEAPADDTREAASAVRDPRHVFLDARAVMRRYGWGKTKGYQNLKDRSLVPPPVMTSCHLTATRRGLWEPQGRARS